MATPGQYRPIQKVTPPLKGSFPLDHEQRCKPQMSDYMRCLDSNENSNERCRTFAKLYFQCRMDEGLMDKDELSRLGYK